MIISASRRTDIPAFFAREFMESIRAGFRIVRNPYSGRETRLSLAPADVECIVFWSKNPEPLLPFLPELEERGYRFYFQFTLTPYGTDIERNLPPKRRILQTFRTLSEQIGAEKVIWRYDPVIFSAEWTAERHSEIFRRMTDRSRRTRNSVSSPSWISTGNVCADRNAVPSGNLRKRKCWTFPPSFSQWRDRTDSAFPPVRKRST